MIAAIGMAIKWRICVQMINGWYVDRFVGGIDVIGIGEFHL